MKKVALADVQENLPKYLRMAEDEDVLITEGGKPAGVLIGFKALGISGVRKKILLAEIKRAAAGTERSRYAGSLSHFY